ncbi:coat protein [Petunia vein banding virus]|uniref:Capsid protein n=1 Tax=Petunia vein banding virus TaxID=147306 RepID=Q99I26_9VIRU|nr:coat protein [Petunia vein banding virus]AAG59998.1 coat protein [Petunia vein banding virus]
MEDSTPQTVKQPSINAPGYSLPKPSSELSSAIVVPFQFQATTFGQAETNAQISLASGSSITKITAPYRHAQLIEAVAEITPTALAIANPITLLVAWVPANSGASPDQILNVFGGMSFTLGAAIASTKSIILPLPINSINMMLKDSVLYTDTPKLLAYSAAPSTALKAPPATIQIRGKIRLSSPLLIAN